VSASDGDEPELHPGDVNDHVLQLQARLQALDLFTESPDGRFGEDTGQALQHLLERAGLIGVGYVDAHAWAALSAAERDAGVVAAPVGSDGAGPDGSPTPVGTLSVDQHWRWDGQTWQPNEQVMAQVAAPAPVGDAQVSADGQWVWDGTHWQPVTG
jgi:peptidoglycan hydrolase-like protein with peptidoglycan-binding domain